MKTKQEPEPIYYAKACVLYFKSRSSGLNENRQTQTSLSNVMAIKRGNDVLIFYPDTLKHRRVQTIYVNGKEVSKRVFNGMMKNYAEKLKTNLLKSIK